MADAARRTVSRRELARNPHFSDVSPEVGVLDEDAFAEAMEEDPEAALDLLSGMAVATDGLLRDLARTLASRLFLDAAHSGTATSSGATRLVHATADVASGDVDLDRSLDELVSARSSGMPIDPSQLHITTWRRPQTAVCLLIDRSGSMHGPKLATAAISAAAASLARSTDCSVIAFSDDSIVLRDWHSDHSQHRVVDDLLSLRGSGTTNLAGALRAARDCLRSSGAARKITLILSDCRVTSGGDAVPVAEELDEVLILAPAEDSADAEDFALRIGARWATYDDPMSTPAVLNQLLADQ